MIIHLPFSSLLFIFLHREVTTCNKSTKTWLGCFQSPNPQQSRLSIYHKVVALDITTRLLWGNKKSETKEGKMALRTIPASGFTKRECTNMRLCGVLTLAPTYGQSWFQQRQT